MPVRALCLFIRSSKYTKQALCQLHNLGCERVYARSGGERALCAHDRQTSDFCAKCANTSTSSPAAEIRKRDSTAVVYQAARECIAVISRGRNSPSPAGGLFSRFYYRLIPAECSSSGGGNNPSTGARLRPLSRRKPRKSLHERFGSLNSSKTTDVVQRTRARYHLNAVAERRCTYFFPRLLRLHPRTRHPLVYPPSPTRAKRASVPLSPRCCRFFSSLPSLFNLANFIRT